MQSDILSPIRELESAEPVRIVYACESGSRAWGFPSADSDYDVRFLYLRPLAWYLSIDGKRDVIELPINNALDINGWDLKKALRLFRKSNPPLLEWLGSPIVYLEPYSIAAKLRELASVYYSPTACLHHYLHMAQGNFREYLQGEMVWVKKYFYVLRPLLAMQWIEQGLGAAPTDFNVLADQLIRDQPLKDDLAKLLTAKRAGAELDKGPRINSISRFIENELGRWEKNGVQGEKTHPPTETLDAFFRESLTEVWR